MTTLERTIWMHLLRLGVPTSLHGYHMLKSAIKLVYVNPKIAYQATTELYPAIEQEYETNSHRVERNIRHAVEYVFSNTDLEVLHEYFGNTTSVSKSKLTNTQFICGVVEYIRMTEGEWKESHKNS